jgi:hypothetical protein
MADTNIDRWRDLMVAALYDEIEPAERDELEARLASDADLRSEWEELQEARARLAVLGETERMIDEETDFAWRGPRPHPGGFRRWALPSAMGFAAAASVFVALLLVGLRVDRTPAGLLVRFGMPEAESGASLAPQPVGPEIVATNAEPLTREEFTRFASLLVNATDSRLDDLERRQSQTQTQLVGQLYDALALTQRRQYEDIRDRLDTAVLQAALADPATRTLERR